MRAVRRAVAIGCVTPMLLIAGCAQTPMGPTVQVMPGPGKTLDAFQADQFTCKQFAENSVAGQAQDANNARSARPRLAPCWVLALVRRSAAAVAPG
jgi:hypothetical protein